MKTEDQLEGQMEKLVKMFAEVIQVMNELEDKIYKLEEAVLDSKKTVIEK